MTDLIARLGAAETGSRELDEAVAEAAGYTRIYNNTEPSVGSDMWQTPDSVTWYSLPSFTTSIDAITALIAEKLPGWSRSSFASGVKGMLCHSRIWHVDHDREFPGSAFTEPLARCIAFLRAIEGTSHDT